MADTCAGLQDQRRQGVVGTDTKNDQPISRASALGSGHGRTATSTALGAFYRRLAARVGKAKAITATARKLAALFYNPLRYGIPHADAGADYYEERYRQRVAHQLHRRARQMGFMLVAVTGAPAGGL